MPTIAAYGRKAGMKRARASRKKSIASERNTVCNTLLVFSVPKNMMNVNSPHRNR